MKYLATIPLAALLLFTACATAINQTSPGIIRDRNLARSAPGLTVASGERGCKAAYTKRVGYALFHLPFNDMDAEEVRAVTAREKGAFSILYREMVYPADIVLSFFGAWFTIITVTKQIDICPAVGSQASKEETNRLQHLARFESERNRLAAIGVPVGLRSSSDKNIRHRVFVRKAGEKETKTEVVEGVIEEIGSEIKIRKADNVQEIPRDSIVAIEALVPLEN